MFYSYFFQTLIAFLIDLRIGDPPKIPHPVIMMGKAIEKAEHVLRKFTSGARSERAAGIVLVIAIVGSSFFLIHGVIIFVQMLHPWLSWIFGAWLISTTIAIKGLADEGRKIYRLLEAGDIEKARVQVGFIVGRDTDHLDEREIVRATVETVAENIVDAVVSPIFYALIGGPALAMAYRSANTLDSMCGYKNDKYRYFGWASARTDDVLNFIPARITGFLLMIAAWLLRLNAGEAYRLWLKDAKKHPSPNSGIPEAVVAGALGVRLGGINVYFGQPKKRAYLGQAKTPLQPIHIKQTVSLLYLTSFLMMISCSILFLIFFLF